MSTHGHDTPKTAEVCLLIRTHALPVLSYVIPDHLHTDIRVGSVVAAPLSGGSHPGVVVALGDGNSVATQALISVSQDLSLTEEMIEVCERIAESSSAELASVLRAALPPKMITNRYRVTNPARGWSWTQGSLVERRVLRENLGDSGFKAAASSGRIEHVITAPRITTEEWAVVTDEPPDFGRARRQQEVYERISEFGGAMTVERLAKLDSSSTGSLRALLRSLVDRGVVTLEDRELVRSIRISDSGSTLRLQLSSDECSEAIRDLLSGGVGIWRVPTALTSEAVTNLVQAVNQSDRSVLVFAPETSQVEELASYLEGQLADGTCIGVYHSRIEEDRAGIWKAAETGELDVLIGTRSAALIPVRDLGAICVVDEPNPSHRAAPGHEGLRMHVRDVARIRSEAQRIPVALLSPRPSLRVYASLLDETLAGTDDEIRELPAPSVEDWPAVRMVDMRGTGASLSSTLIDTCEDFLDTGKSIAVVVNRVGHTAVVCGGCGGVRSCPDCDVPFLLREGSGEHSLLVCGRCGYSEDFVPNCPECGSMRHSKVRPSVDSIRRELQRELNVTVGVRTSSRRWKPNADILAGTVASLLGGGRERYDLVVLPDADSLLLASWMGSAEHAFAGIFSAAESAREMLLVQTTNLENHTLRSAVRGDYRAFASAELPRLKRLGYPPYAYLASIEFEGRRDAVLGAVESQLLPHVEPQVASSGVVPGSGGEFRMLLRSSDRAAIIRTANRAARALARLPVRGPKRVRATIEIDPEEV